MAIQQISLKAFSMTGLPRFADGTTGETTSHLTKLQTAQQVIGYSHLTKAASCQVIGYRNDIRCKVTSLSFFDIIQLVRD